MKLITAMPEQQPRRPPREQSAPNTALPRPRWRRASIKWWCGRDVTMRAVVAGWLICLPSLPFIMYPPHGRSQHAGTLRRAFLSHVRSADGGPLDSAQMATMLRPVQKSSLSLCGSDVFLQKYPSQPPKCLLLYLRSWGSITLIYIPRRWNARSWIHHTCTYCATLWGGTVLPLHSGRIPFIIWVTSLQSEFLPPCESFSWLLPRFRVICFSELFFAFARGPG